MFDFKRFVIHINKYSSLFADRTTNDKTKNFIMGEDDFWDNSLTAPAFISNAKIGDVYKFHFGKNPKPEMSYYHMGIVISKNSSYLYVLPITSYDVTNQAFANAVDVNNEPQRKHRFYMMLKTDFPFLNNDSVIKTSDIRTCSHLRIATKVGTVDPSSTLFLAIHKTALQYVFPNIDSQMSGQKIQIDNFAKSNSLLKMNNAVLTAAEYLEMAQFDEQTIKSNLQLEEYEFFSDIISDKDGCVLAEIYAKDSYGQESVHKKIKCFIKSE